MDWIIHLDTDELMHPQGVNGYSIQKFLAEMSGDVDAVVFPNYVSEWTAHYYIHISRDMLLKNLNRKMYKLAFSFFFSRRVSLKEMT